MPIKISKGNEKPGRSDTGRAVLALRALIFRGELPPAERLSEAALASRLNVPRLQIRRALERLALEELIVSSASGFAVREFTNRDIYDAIELQSVLEGTAARLAAARMVHRRELRAIRGYHEKMMALIKRHQSSPRFWAKPSNDLARYAQLNGSFHQALVDLAKSPLIRSAVERIHAIPFSSPTSITVPAGSEDIPQIAMRQHGAILDAIEKRQPELAERLARQHGLLALRNVEFALESAPLHGHIPRIALIKAGA